MKVNVVMYRIELQYLSFNVLFEKSNSKVKQVENGSNNFVKYNGVE